MGIILWIIILGAFGFVLGKIQQSTNSEIIKVLIRHWYATLVLGGAVIMIIGQSFQSEKKSLIIVENYNHTEAEVTEDDLRVTDIWNEGETFIINNANRSIYLESVVYTTRHSPSYTPQTFTIRSNSTYATDENISYIFTSPPSSINIPQNFGTVKKWHLHR